MARFSVRHLLQMKWHTKKKGENSSSLCIIAHATNFAESASQIEGLLERLGSGGARRTPKIAKGTRDFGPKEMQVALALRITISHPMKMKIG